MRCKNALIFLIDLVSMILAKYLANIIVFQGNVPTHDFLQVIISLFVMIIIKMTVYSRFHFYRSAWEYASIEDLERIVTGAFAANGIFFLYLLWKHSEYYRIVYTSILTFQFDILFLGINRYACKIFIRHLNGKSRKGKKAKRIMVVGAGDAGASLIRQMKDQESLNYQPVALIDDDVRKRGLRIYGVPVLGGRSDIAAVASKKRIDEIIIAIPSINSNDMAGIIEECKKTKCRLKTLPSLVELMENGVTIKGIRDVQIEDLLYREVIRIRIEEVSEYIRGRRILVTSGGGSIGSELCRQIATFCPGELIILDAYENNVHNIRYELQREYETLNLKVFIGSIRDRDRMLEVMEKAKPDLVFHAAAHKHVTLMEENPKEAVKNNVFGTLNAAWAADRCRVKKFVLISTDKAVNPTSVMGATKRICEMIIQSMNSISQCKYTAVRFGNVLGSNGSVVPLFKRQIVEGGPVTVTHKDVTRYFMTIIEAAQLVIQAGAMAAGGEIFILDMGKPVGILKLAEDLIRFSGLKPYKDIPIELIGLRPGEKLYEELFKVEEGMELTDHEKIFVTKPPFMDYEKLKGMLEHLKQLLKDGTDEQVIDYIAEMVPSYRRRISGGGNLPSN